MNVPFARSLILASFFVVSSVAAPNPAISSTPLLDCASLPCVDVQVGGGKQLRLGIDTGNVTSVLNAQAAAGLGLKTEPYVGEKGQRVPGLEIASISGVKIGATAIGTVRMAVMNLSDQISAGKFPKMDGTLAYTAFSGRLLQLDYVHHVLNVSEVLDSAPTCPQTCGRMSLITFGKDGPPIVTTTGFSVNGKPIIAQLDTMYTGTLLIYPTSVEKLGLSRQSKSTQTRYFPFTDGGVSMDVSSAASESFGNENLVTNAPIYFAGPKVHLPDGLFDATVGIALLNKRTVTFDFKGMRFSLT
jgi:hypothetical protein